MLHEARPVAQISTLSSQMLDGHDLQPPDRGGGKNVMLLNQSVHSASAFKSCLNI